MAVTGSRITRLERAMGVGRPGTPCGRCGGVGMGAMTVVRDEADIGKPKGGCPACGKISCIIKYIIALSPGQDPASDPWDIV